MNIKMMFNIILIAALGVMIGCNNGGTRGNLNLPPAAPITGSVTIPAMIPFTEGKPIAANIKNECTLGQQLSEFVASSAAGKVDVQRSDSVSPESPGQVLMIEITDSVSAGNAFIGHRKYTQIMGTLYNNGKKVSSFTGHRNSMGGAFAGFKGSCSVLGRTVEALGQDVARWFGNPQQGASIGD